MTRIWTIRDAASLIILALLIMLLFSTLSHAQVCTDLGGGDYVCRGGGNIMQCSNLGGTIVCR